MVSFSILCVYFHVRDILSSEPTFSSSELSNIKAILEEADESLMNGKPWPTRAYLGSIRHFLKLFCLGELCRQEHSGSDSIKLITAKTKSSVDRDLALDSEWITFSRVQGLSKQQLKGALAHEKVFAGY